MKLRLPALFGSRTPQPPPAPRRSRWPVLFGALVLVWCAWWYCREGSQGLLFLAAGAGALAAARPRALPGTARWIIWGGVALTVACLAANVARLVPPESALAETRSIDRLVTVAFALGLASLFFRPSADGVTLVAAGGLPLAMVVLARGENTPGAAVGAAGLIVWVLVALLAAADLAQRLTQARRAEGGAPGAAEAGRRLCILAALVALSFGLRPPVEWAARGVQKLLFGWVLYPDHAQRRTGGDLWLTVPVPADFGQRTRAVLLVGADSLPGYLRERVFIRYPGGRWTASKPETPLRERPALPPAPARGVYALAPGPEPATSLVWRVEVLAPGLLAGFCLPGNAVTLACDGAPPVGDACGSVAAKEQLPERYELAVAPSRILESAYPWPDGLSDPAYLAVPASLSGAVSNWVAACAGLAEAPTLPEAIRRVEAHFAAAFTYRLGLRMKSAPDPLVDFMARKEGSCTLFASAAALMFRSCGVPSRVVEGFVCSGWNPWLERWVARERDGHAWVEVWDRASGRWLVADPTPPDGRPAAMEGAGKIRLALDLLAAGWKRLAGYLRKANFLEVIADAGETLFLFVWQVALSLPGAVVLLGLGAVWWLRRRARRRTLAPSERVRAELACAMERLARRSVPAHLRRRASESWSAWLLRAGPELPPARRRELRGRLAGYQALRYRAALDEEAARVWIAEARKAGRGARAAGADGEPKNSV